MNTTTNFGKHAITAAALVVAGCHAPRAAATDFQARINSSGGKMNFNRVILAAVAAVGLIGSVEAGTTPYCIAVNGGFENGGTTFVARDFTIPAANQCSPWAGYTKTSGTVVLNTSGSACVSEDGHVLTVGVSSFNPNWTGGAFAPDYIQICPTGVKCTSADLSVADKPLQGNGIDRGFFGGSAEEITCTQDLLTLPNSHA